MKEKPIIFSGGMVMALLDGRKTETRRVIKPQPPDGRVIGPELYYPVVIDRYGDEQPAEKPVYGVYDEWGEWGAKCPYGAPGDRLWVRETLKAHDPDNDGEEWVTYVVDGTEVAGGRRWWWKRNTLPSIFMPRWASRITLEVTGVRVERVQGISEEGAEAEGIKRYPGSGIPITDPRTWFSILWDGINAKRGYSWESNPCVWVVEFEVIKE